MAAFTKFNQFVEDLAGGVHNLKTGTSHVLKVLLTSTAPVATNAVKADWFLSSMVRATANAQHSAVPLFGPAAPLVGMPERLIDATALYAGETASRITTIVPASQAVADVAGSAGT